MPPDGGVDPWRTNGPLCLEGAFRPMPPIPHPGHMISPV